jgi:uncharacterized coiled-coil protein SlyX
MADNITKPPLTPKQIPEDDTIEQLSRAIVNINQTVQTLAFVIDYIIEKYDIDVDDLQKYLDNRIKEYMEKVKESMKASNIVVPK